MSNVLTFFSPVGNIGLTATVHTIAATLSSRTESRIAVLNLNAWDDGTDYIEEPDFTLDQIKSRLSGRMFHNDEDFLSKFTQIRENFLVLSGNRDTKLERLYTVDEVKYLIERTKELFDIVLIDAGSHVDNALSAEALEQADDIFILLSQQAKSAKQFSKFHDDILVEYPIYKKDLHLIINKYQSRTYLNTDDTISKEVDVPLFATIPYVENALLCEIEKKWSLLFDDKDYAKTINAIAEKIAEKSNLVLLENASQKKRGLFSFSR